MKSNTTPQKFSVHKITRAGMLISISIVLKMVFEFYVPISGFNGLRINLGTIPIMLSGIILGPTIGFFTGAITDLINFLLKPSGAFFPGFTLVSALTGMIPGLIYKNITEKANFNILNILFSFLLTLSTLLILFSKNILYFENKILMYDNSNVKLIYILLFAILVFAYIYIPVYFGKIIGKSKNIININKICFTVNVTQFFASIILNTYFLSVLYNQGFLLFLPARIITNFFIIPLYSLIISVILNLFDRFF